MPFNIPPTLVIDGTMSTLLIFSVATWTVILFKIWQFSVIAYYNRRYHQAFWDAPSLAAAADLPAHQARGPKARLARSGFNWLAEMHQGGVKALKYQGTPVELLEQALRRQAQFEQRSMESGLTLLASIGSTAPFVGLFGTVVGIMNALHDIGQSGSASLDVVAGPIGDALVATAVGIAVAVPAVLAYNFFLRRAKHHRISLDNFADGFLHIAFSAAAPHDTTGS
ncbi:MAG: MotA/TolQ/ExbB proton channel family protein [Gammaproteobacteria bacterium]